MRVKPPSIDTLSAIAESYGMDLSDDDLDSFHGLIAPIMASYERLDQLPEPTLPVKYPRTPGHRPTPQDNPLNAWYWRSEIKGASDGLLAGKTVAIKDNVSVAGVPMMNGTAILEGYVRDADATIVTRILDAGGTILGKAVCESLCISGGSHTSDTGPVRWVRGSTPAEVERETVQHPEPDPAHRQARLEREAKARVRSRDIIGKATR